jgi:tetratricopeptide (TPR) repeat protein
MPNPRTPSSAPVPVAEIERHIRWPVLPAIVFLGILVALGVVAAIGSRGSPPIVTGLPADPDVRAAADLVRGRLKVDAGALRFPCALLGENVVVVPNAPGDDRSRAGAIGAGAAKGSEGAGEPGPGVTPENGVRPATPADGAVPVAKAAAYLSRARARKPRDLRIASAAASLDLARGELERSESRYRVVLDRGPGYGEARLGLGVTLALRGDRAASRKIRRRLLLEAIAQFAAVRERDPVYEAALYNRALLLERVGRREEARRVAREYLALDGTSEWAERMRGELGQQE